MVYIRLKHTSTCKLVTAKYPRRQGTLILHLARVRQANANQKQEQMEQAAAASGKVSIHQGTRQRDSGQKWLEAESS